MKVVWEIDDSDVKKVQNFYNTHKGNAFVLNRHERNVKKIIPELSEISFWEAMVSCLLTTQQRSGPESAVTRFICTKPFPLNLSECKKSENLRQFAEGVITGFGGIRRAITLGEEIQSNFGWLEGGGWTVIRKIGSDLKEKQGRDAEREAATIIMGSLKGFGPKQSRNLLQALGLTRYEIPIDSRITKWLNHFGFPIRLSAGALADPNYYNFVLDGFQKLCEAVNIYPCVMDAAIFASSDTDWPEDKLVW